MARRKWKMTAATILAVALSTLGLLAASMTLGFSDGTVEPGNQNCAQNIPSARELRVDPAAEGTFTDGTLTVNIDIRTLAADVPDHPGDQTGSEVFDFTATGGTVIGVKVKGGPNTNFYDYRPAGVTSGTGLHAPVGPGAKFSGLSHISFCYVVKASPAIVTQASASITIGGSVTDTATLSGGNNPTGTITFRLFGPNDATCAGLAAFTSVVPVNGNGNYVSGSFTPSAPGTYLWTAVYSGDNLNNPATSPCNATNESVVVNRAQPAMSTLPNVLPNDTATLDGFNPTGTITFDLYLNADCTGAAAGSFPVTVNGDGTYASTNTTIKVVSPADTVVSWIVTYSGDANNAPATSGCTAEQADIDFTPIS
jgi:hypothetical protein